MGQDFFWNQADGGRLDVSTIDISIFIGPQGPPGVLQDSSLSTDFFWNTSHQLEVSTLEMDNYFALKNNAVLTGTITIDGSLGISGTIAASAQLIVRDGLIIGTI